MTNREEFWVFWIVVIRWKQHFKKVKLFYLAECVQGKPTAKAQWFFQSYISCFNHCDEKIKIFLLRSLLITFWNSQHQSSPASFLGLFFLVICFLMNKEAPLPHGNYLKIFVSVHVQWNVNIFHQIAPSRVAQNFQGLGENLKMERKL